MQIQNGFLVNPEVRIENTNRCQSNCTICPREKLTRPYATLGQKHFESLVDQVRELGATYISIFGFGEPLMDKGLVDKVAYCTKWGMETFITTNAGLLTPEKTEELLAAGLGHIRFSAHGLTAKTYEDVHRGLSFHQIMANIGQFILHNALYNHGACVTSMSVIPLHAETIEQIRKVWEPKVDYLEVWRPHNWTDGRGYRAVQKRKKTCGRPFSGPLQINADGKMMVCCFDFNAVMTIGDTFKMPIAAILNNIELEIIQDAHRAGNLRGLPCNDCDQLNEYSEEDYPLLYSNRDLEKTINTTSSMKFKLGE